ncbi:MAG TPA: TatD family hydrolase [Burkholderiaceae bacterium]|nr:TatD family hydrolase [Burkholderiaceae bacterium]
MLIDTHCHLDAAEFDADRDAVVGAAIAAGVARIVVPAVEIGNFGAVRSLAARHEGVRYALGIHPLFVDRASDDDLARLRAEVEASLDDPRFVGVGEIGLDHFVPGLDRARQERFLAEQIRVARDFDLPVILHVRRAQDGVLKQLRRFRPRGGIAHAFNGSLQQADAFVGLGCALGFGGAMTFGRALQIRRLAQAMPLEAIVLETDAPDIAPAWIRDGRNEPAELPRIAAELAALRGIALDEAVAATGANARRVLPRFA